MGTAQKKDILELFEQSKESLSGKSTALTLIQEKAKEKLSQLSRPGIKHENWKYTSTRWLEESSWNLATTEYLSSSDKKSNQLVFINGVFF